MREFVVQYVCPPRLCFSIISFPPFKGFVDDVVAPKRDSSSQTYVVLSFKLEGVPRYFHSAKSPDSVYLEPWYSQVGKSPLRVPEFQVGLTRRYLDYKSTTSAQ